jgi:hypothetical protein
MVSSIYYARIGRGRGGKKNLCALYGWRSSATVTEIYKIESQQINIKINI